jgi:CBS-domain-containing membrane protein
MNDQVANTLAVRASARLKYAVRGFLGGAAAIALMALLGHATNSPLLMAPFGASSVLLFGAPYSPFAQPRNLVLGHLLATAVGLGVFWLAGAGVWQMAISVGLAIALMQLGDCVHPPAGADPLVIMLTGHATISFFFVPVLAGVWVLLAVALLFNNLMRERRWPERWS